MDDFLNEALERQRNWGPSPNKNSWTEMCERMSAANPSRAKEISSSPLFMSSQILKLKIPTWTPNMADHYMQILYALRPEDAIHIPKLSFDYDTGKIIEWNRSLSDLTGISAAQVVGKAYAEVLDEWIPNLTKEYKLAAVEWATKKEEHESEYHDEEDCREDYLFPLPLPIRYDSSFKYVSGNRHYDEYIELLAAGTDHLIKLYPKFQSSYKGVPQYMWNREATKDGWNFDTSGWVGGVEFTLRRKQYVPSLQTLCRELLPKGDHAFNEDGSLAVTKPTPENSEEQVPETPEEVYTAISNYIRSCGPIGVDYIREILNAVCKKTRNRGLRTKSFSFSNDGLPTQKHRRFTNMYYLRWEVQK
jgi:PAS domain-containing protein